MKFSVSIILMTVPAVSILGWVILNDLDHNQGSFGSQEEIGPCLSRSADFQKIQCLRHYFTNLTKNDSADTAVSQAKKLKKQGDISDCHLITHFIGEANLEKYNLDFGKAFSSCPYGCAEGCFHGVMEAYVGRQADRSNIISSMEKICKSISKDALLYRQCSHGVGHGLLAHSYLSIAGAINACQNFGSQIAIEGCLQGVFMENMDKYLLSSEEYLSKILPSICLDVVRLNDDKLVSDCIVSVGEGLMIYTGHNLKKSYGLCEKLSPAFIHICKAAAKEEQEAVR